MARPSDWVQETPALRHQSPASLELGPTRTLVYSTAGVSKCTVRECATCARNWGVEMATVLKCVRSFADWNRSGCGTIGEEGRRRKRESAQDARDDSDKSPCFQWSQRPWKFQSDESSPQVLLCVVLGRDGTPSVTLPPPPLSLWWHSQPAPACVCPSFSLGLTCRIQSQIDLQNSTREI